MAEAGKHYGEGIIKEYSKRLIIEVGKKYSETTLRYYRLFYNTVQSNKKTFLYTCNLHIF